LLLDVFIVAKRLLLMADFLSLCSLCRPCALVVMWKLYRTTNRQQRPTLYSLTLSR